MATPVPHSGYPICVARYAGTAWGGQAAGTLVSPSFTPPAGRLLVAFGWSSENANLTLSGGGLTWTQKAATGSYPREYVWQAVAPSSPSAIQLTLASDSNATHLGLAIYAADSADTSGLGAVFATSGYDPGSSPYSVAAPGGVAAGSLLLGSIALSNISNLGSFTAASGCVEDFGTGNRDEQGVETASPWPRRWSVGRITTGSAYGGTVSGNVPFRMGGIVAEVKAVPVAITSITPSSGPTIGGTAVTIAGVGFTNGTLGALTFGGSAAASVVVVSDTTITLVTPAHAAGAVDVALTIGSTTVTVAGGYTYVDTLSISPSHGPASGGTLVTLSSNGWFASGAVVTVGGGGITATLVDSGTLRYIAPAHAAGSVTVSVTANGITKTVTYTYDLVVTPNQGPDTGGTTVRLIGVASGAPAFGGSAATGVTPYDWNSITCVTPAHAAGAVNVVVGSITAAGAFTYLSTQPENSLTGRAPILKIGTATSCAGLDQLSNLEIDLQAGQFLQIGEKRIPFAIAAGMLRGAEMTVERIYMSDRNTPVGTYTVFSGRVEVDCSSSQGKILVESWASGLKRVLVPRNPLQAPCPNLFGDANCGINLSDLRLPGTVAYGASNRTFVATASGGIFAKPTGYFLNGVLAVTSGACAGQTRTIVGHVRNVTDSSFDLSTPLRGNVSAGDSFTVTPDCAKTLAACDAYGNRPRFRGTPFIETHGLEDGALPVNTVGASMRFNSWIQAMGHDEDRDWTAGQSFDLEFTPSAITSVRLMGESPYELIAGSDYSIAGRTITILSLPAYGRAVIHVAYSTPLHGVELEGNDPALSTIFTVGQSIAISAGTWTDSSGVARNLDGTYTAVAVSDRWIAVDGSWSVALPSAYMPILIAGT